MARQDIVGTHKTVTFTDEDGYAKVVYHNTAVVAFNKKKVILDSGGWKTATTKTRMNQASRQFRLGYSIFQKNYEWWVEYKGKVAEFQDGIVLYR